jgi:hypothetical protein
MKKYGMICFFQEKFDILKPLEKIFCLSIYSVIFYILCYVYDDVEIYTFIFVYCIGFCYWLVLFQKMKGTG